MGFRWFSGFFQHTAKNHTSQPAVALPCTIVQLWHIGGKQALTDVQELREPLVEKKPSARAF